MDNTIWLGFNRDNAVLTSRGIISTIACCEGVSDDWLLLLPEDVTGVAWGELDRLHAMNVLVKTIRSVTSER